MVNRSASLNTSQILKVIGIVFIFFFLIDFVILLLGYTPNNSKEWTVNLTQTLVAQGIIPLFGIGMILTSYWMDEVDEQPLRLDFRFPTLILSSVLGLIYLLIFPGYLINASQVKTQQVALLSQQKVGLENKLSQELSQNKDKLEQVKSRAKNELTQILKNEQQYQQLIGNPQTSPPIKELLQKAKTSPQELDKITTQLINEQIKNRVKADLTQVLKNEQQYQQLIANPQTPSEIKELLKKAKTNPQELDKPQALDKIVALQINPEENFNRQRNNLLQESEETQRKLEKNNWHSGLKIGISSLLLSVGYFIIGATGLKSLGFLQGGKRKAKVR